MSHTQPESAQTRSAEQSTERWFVDEVQPHGAQLKAWLRNAFPNMRSEVDDVVQESFLRVWKRHAVKPIVSAKAFLFTAARNVAIDFLRKNRTEHLSDSELSSVIEDRPDAAEVLSTQERYDLLVEAVAKLPNRCREVVLLHKFKGLSQREVGERLGISERTVEVHVRTAVAHCEKYLRSKGVTTLDD